MENDHYQWTLHSLSPTFFYTPEEESIFTTKSEKFAVNLSGFNFTSSDSLNNLGEYYFPPHVVHAVKFGLSELKFKPTSETYLGNLIYLFYILDKRIRNIRQPIQQSLNPSFDYERKSLFKLFDLFEKKGTSLLSVNIKMDQASIENDLLLKDKDVLEFLKQMLYTANERAKDVQTLGHFYKTSLEAIQPSATHKALDTALPLLVEDFRAYYAGLEDIIGSVTKYKRTQFMSIILLHLKCLDNEMLQRSFDSQETHSSLVSYLQEKITKKIGQ
jgi:hypothetical protein|tara:strand:+ start:2563 stop:3381 length:819 start_codon:yes stop_codon:yes gene_type:complete